MSDCEAYGKYLRERDRDKRWGRKDAMPLEGRDGAWAGAKGPDLERTHQDPLRRALKDAACSIARSREVGGHCGDDRARGRAQVV